MTRTAFTRRVLVVARPSLAPALNRALDHVSFDPAGGDHTLEVPLRAAGDASNKTAAYWCSGALTPAMVTGLRTRLQAGGATAAEVKMAAPGAQFPAGWRVLCFDGDQWTPDEVLDVLGLDRIPDASTEED